MRLLILLIFLLPISDAAQILAFFPMSYKSHQIVFQHLLKGLAAKGHKITYVTSSPMSESHKNIEEIFIDEVSSDIRNPSVTDVSLMRHANKFTQYFTFWNDCVHRSELVLRKSVIQDFIRQKRKFDVILAEIFFHQQPFIGLANVFHAPVIDVNTNCGSHAYNHFFYNPNIYSYITDFNTWYSERMTLHQRLMNTLFGVFEAYVSFWHNFPRQEQIFHSNFNMTDLKIETTSLRVSLQNYLVASIINSDPVLGYPRPLMPNTVQVAGITVPPRKFLPRDLQKFMDEAESGVIYFSLGTNLEWEKLGTKHKNFFVQAFDRLPQRVLWKTERDLQIKSPKILTGKWFPQGDILAHPNCRLFITHGGYLSLVETVDAGVPVIVIPFFADQPRNAHLAEAKAFGMHLNFDEITADVIVDTVQEVLGNKSYSDNAKKMSALFKDRVVSPLDKAVHLVEYVIRHKGHPASQTGAKELSCFQYFLLDVIAIIVTIVLVIFSIMYKIIRIVLSLLCSGSTVSKKKSSNSTKKTK